MVSSRESRALAACTDTTQGGYVAILLDSESPSWIHMVSIGHTRFKISCFSQKSQVVDVPVHQTRVTRSSQYQSSGCRARMGLGLRKLYRNDHRARCLIRAMRLLMPRYKRLMYMFTKPKKLGFRDLESGTLCQYMGCRLTRLYSRNFEGFSLLQVISLPLPY